MYLALVQPVVTKTNIFRSSPVRRTTSVKYGNVFRGFINKNKFCDKTTFKQTKFSKCKTLAIASPKDRGEQTTRDSTEGKKGIPYENITIGVVVESFPGERRVAATPSIVKEYIKKGFCVKVETGAGLLAEFNDVEYAVMGAEIVDTKTAWGCDIVTKIRPPVERKEFGIHEIDMMKDGAMYMGFLYPAQNESLLEKMAAKNLTVFGMDQIPRTISRAQTFDALSSMANISGYRAVVEAASQFGRMFTGQITAAGRMPPAKVLVIGAGVAGLAAIAAAKSMGAIVRCFDTRPVCKEQVESAGAEWVYPELEEDGSGEGGYAKTMSEEFMKAEMALFAEQAKDVDIIITTALIPGREAPVLITEDMIKSMKPGSVTVDLAAEAGGNIETTVPNEIVKTHGVTCIGYTDLPSRMSSQASALYSNNISKFLFSMGAEKDTLEIDHDDLVVRGALVLENGQLLWPAPKPDLPSPPPPKQPPKVLTPEEIFEQTETINKEEATKGAIIAIAVGLAFLGLGTGSDMELTSQLGIFTLAGMVGYQVVWGVTPALHSPLMSVTNAISGMTAVGGLLMMGGDLIPETPAQWLASVAVLVSSVNIGGGFLMTGRMLDMFKRDTDPSDFSEYYLAAGVALATLYGVFSQSGNPEGVTQMTYLLASVACILGIGGLSSQKTASLGNKLGVVGVGLGLVCALASVDASPQLYIQMFALLAAGGTIGLGVASKTGVTGLPQLVAAFHSLVGLAAVTTSVGSFLEVTGSGGMEALDGMHSIATFLGTFIGGVTLTGSIVAFGKLSGRISGRALSLPGKNFINAGLALACVPAYLVYSSTGDTTLALEMLMGVMASSFFLGYHSAASVGGADMPVIITLLNSYSGWALCTEGFVLNNEMLTIVGALIGSSGAILSYIMCQAMNRSLTDVVFGGTPAPKTKVLPGGEEVIQKEASVTNVDAVAESLVAAKKVLIVPGYGMAVANAQYAVASITNALAKNGTTVHFGVHPVAGRMPGQLNVLLAEARVPYDVVFEMDEVNEMMGEYDVTVVIGANDTVNSAAVEDPDSILAGMPVIRVWEAEKCYVMKRSLAQGYAAVENPLFYKDNTEMFLGDAKASCDALLSKIQEFTN